MKVQRRPFSHFVGAVCLAIVFLVLACGVSLAQSGLSQAAPTSSSLVEATNHQALLQAVRSALHDETNASTRSSSSMGASGNAGEKSDRIDNLDALDDQYKLNIGDRVSFRITEDEDPPVELSVTDSGDLEIPYLGLCSASGKTCKQLAVALKKELEKQYYYKATVVIAVKQW